MRFASFPKFAYFHPGGAPTVKFLLVLFILLTSTVFGPACAYFSLGCKVNGDKMDYIGDTFHTNQQSILSNSKWSSV